MSRVRALPCLSTGGIGSERRAAGLPSLRSALGPNIGRFRLDTRRVNSMKLRSLRPAEVLRIAVSKLRLAARRTLVEVPFHGATMVANLKTPYGLSIYRYRRHSDADPELSLVARYLYPGACLSTAVPMSACLQLLAPRLSTVRDLWCLSNLFPKPIPPSNATSQ